MALDDPSTGTWYVPPSFRVSYNLAAQLRSTNITDQHANYGTATAPCISSRTVVHTVYAYSYVHCTAVEARPDSKFRAEGSTIYQTGTIRRRRRRRYCVNSAPNPLCVRTFVQECCTQLCLIVYINNIVRYIYRGMLAARPPAHHAMMSEGTRGANRRYQYICACISYLFVKTGEWLALGLAGCMHAYVCDIAVPGP